MSEKVEHVRQVLMGVHAYRSEAPSPEGVTAAHDPSEDSALRPACCRQV